MGYDYARRLRLQPEEYQYRPLMRQKVEYVFVDHGFFRLRALYPDDHLHAFNLFMVVFAKLLTIYGFYHIFAYQRYISLFLVFTLKIVSLIGNTVGCHRMWSHRAFDAHWSLRVFLMIAYCFTAQGSLFEWSRGHRLHHKFTDTDSDPNNPRRGLWYAHIGWFLKTEHPDVARAEAKLTVDDVWADPIVRFHHQNNNLLTYLMMIASIAMHYVLVGDTLLESILFLILRINMSLHAEVMINSAAHLFGNRPYKPECSATEHWFVSIGALGEGCHNYHHKFPYDYRTGEGVQFGHNYTHSFIVVCIWLGLIYNLRHASDNLIRITVENARQRTAGEEWSNISK